MKEKHSILDLMVKDHCRIEELIDDFEGNTKKDYSSIFESFSKLEWTIEKHIFMEEKAVFTFYNPENVVEGYRMLPELTQQHNVILNKLDLIRKDVRSRRNIKDLYGFKEFLIKHKNFEEKEVYPKLDQNLDEEKKKIIIDRINEII